MRVSADDLVVDVLHHFRHIEFIGLIRDLRIQYDLQEQVAEFFAHAIRIVRIQRRQRFIRFFQQMLAKGLVCLLLVPRTAVRRAQMTDDFSKRFKGCPLAERWNEE